MLLIMAPWGWSHSLFAQGDALGCTDFWACNYDPEAIEDDGSCEYQTCLGCTNQYACNFDPTAIYYDGSCEFLSCVGCMSPDACNFDPSALVPNQAACDFESCVGCTDFTACSFDPEATLSDPTQCDYPLPDEDCDGNPTGCGGCEPEFVTDFSPGIFECADELPLEPLGDMVAVSGCTGDTLDVETYVVDATTDYVLNVGTTADGIGPDGAIRVFGLTALGLANSDYFIETYPMLVSRYANGIAVVSGQVQNAANPNLLWNVHLVLEDPRNGDEWLAEDPGHGFITAYGCSIDTASTITYQLVGEQSYLIGAGGYEGSYLQLSHMPSNGNKRFQLGVGGNSVNCNYGFGGWFAWSGRVLGEDVSGMTGDLVIDLEEDVHAPVACGSEMTVHFHHALNADCGQFTEVVQVFQRANTQAPGWTENSSCAAEVYLCFDDATGAVELPEPCAFEFEDACGEEITTAVQDLVLTGDPLGAPDQPFSIERVYSGSDCSGLTGTFVQTIVFEGSPCPEAPTSPVKKPAFSQGPNARGALGEAALPEVMLSGLAPNPTNSTSFLDVTPPGSGPVTMRVFNLAGSVVLDLPSVQAITGETLRIELPGHELATGCYLIQADCQGMRETLRWAIQR
jgi:hypothetical protein